jgi:DNA-3-methyladenine glycosylase II
VDKRTIRNGMRALAAIDSDVADALNIVGLPQPRLRPVGFKTLFNTIASQQISTEAARSILARVETLMSEVTPQALLAVDDRSLREAGLSYRKIEYAKGTASAIVAGEFDVEGLTAMSDDEVIAAITALRGFGRWSAEIYLMFSLRRRDIFPADDLALRTALWRLKQLAEKPTANQAREMVTHWAPWRSVGSLFLWHYYRGEPT